MSGPCAKKRVVCTIVSVDGEEFVGENLCNNPQSSCPRVGSLYARDDFTLCKTICDQPGHAEVMALSLAGEKAKGAIAIVEHHRICPDCEKRLISAGIKYMVTEEKKAP